MNQINNNPKLKEKRKFLRNNSTSAEKTLWLLLKAKQTGFKFRRQHSVGNYILDFYCPSKLLAVELDGDVHYNEDSLKKDTTRTNYLNSEGIEVIRFDNDEVTQRPEIVVEKIIEHLNSH
ncbi:MAG: endonuclease domain-containing protein [Bacteroidia bacterium]|nr:endonuclease domain-containing protein [Bacteroidia bacterium]